jgi:alkylhydroperoxidase/carboxymuconolactone decarboxylase family protein YurZ
MSETDELRARLAGLRAKRGYLLPHHGLMAVTAPGLLAAYDAAYTALALDDRVLSHHDREFVWLGILIATREEIATHHIEKFRNAGGTAAEIRACLRLAAAVCGFRAYGFVHDHWRPHLPGIDPEAEWAETVLGAGDGAEERLVHLSSAAMQVANGAWDGFRWQLRQAYAAGIDERELAEAVSLTMFPASVPFFVTAAQVWMEMIRAGELDASPAFQEWAMLSGQGGHGANDRPADDRAAGDGAAGDRAVDGRAAHD